MTDTRNQNPSEDSTGMHCASFHWHGQIRDEAPQMNTASAHFMTKCDSPCHDKRKHGAVNVTSSCYNIGDVSWRRIPCVSCVPLATVQSPTKGKQHQWGKTAPPVPRCWPSQSACDSVLPRTPRAGCWQAGSAIPLPRCTSAARHRPQRPNNGMFEC